MGYFPLCIDLSGKTVFFVGDGAQIRDKAEKLKPFSAHMVIMSDLKEEALSQKPALVIVGDIEHKKAERISALCRERNIPVNVVDVPALCTFFFPAMIVNGDLTVSVSTGGSSPAAAAYLRKKLEADIPAGTDEILHWLGENRAALREAGILKEAVAAAFEVGRPLTREECERLGKNT